MSGKPLRLAVYGFVEKNGAAQPAANFMLLERLLRRGYRIDFYAVDPWIHPKELLAFPTFRYFGYSLPRWEWGWKLAYRLPTLFQRAYSKLVFTRYTAAINRAISRAHRESPYGALLTLGLLSPFSVPDLPAISWAQGTPNGEREALSNQRSQIVKFSGRILYWVLMAHYHVKELVTRRQLPRSDYVIDGSRWAIEKWHSLGLKPGHGFAFPYALDLKRFTPSAREAATGRPLTLLHFGRLVPRKRLDLLLEAFQLLRSRDPEVRLRIVGYFAYANGFAKLLRDPRLMAGVEYQPKVSPEEAAKVLREADILVQPSENENFGHTVAEAQACGLPVILGPTNGTGDYLDTDEFRFSDYTSESVAEAMGRAVRAIRTKPTEVRAQARAAAERYYDAEYVADLLDPVLQRAGGRAA